MNKSITFKIKLDYIKPAIWRVFKVNETEDLFSLHQIIQVVMGWENAHLFEFTCQNRRIGLIHDDDEPWGVDEEVEDSESVTLKDLDLKINDKLMYVYDFGDDWIHQLQVLEISTEELDKPVCLKGERSCPPEDCGGPHGYMHLLSVLKNPNSPEYAEIIEWIGDDFDPELFDLAETNELLEEFEDWRDSMESDDLEGL
ncbi:MAG: plasmid pRiA4b ORF-3 family protein [Saprospiraceae bacterium]